MAKLTQETRRKVVLEIFEADIRDMIQAYADKVAGSIPRDANIAFDVSGDGRAALTKISVEWTEEDQPGVDVF